MELQNFNTDLEDIKLNDLVDIREVKIDQKLPKEIRVQQFIEQIKNPYCFKVGDVIVRCKFQTQTSGETLQKKLERYFSSL